MSDGEKNMTKEDYTSDSESQEQGQDNSQSLQNAPKQGQRTMQRARRQEPPAQQQQQQNPYGGQQGYGGEMQPQQQQQQIPMNRTWPIRESRIKDRPQPKEVRDSSLKIKIELDLEVEVDLYARVKGDVTIGLM